MNGVSDSPPVAAVLLAAGAGSRFGGGRGEKLLADFQGRPLVTHAMSALASALTDGVFVVVGDAGGEAAEIAGSYGFEVVENAYADEGQATSVLAGLGAVEESGIYGGMLVMLGDQPLVSGEVISRLVEAFRDGARIAVASYSGDRRNPVLFSSEVWGDLRRELVGDEGARSFLKARSDLIVEVECGDIGSAADVDTREDLDDLNSVAEDFIRRRRRIS